MQTELEDAVEHAKASEAERNKIHRFKKVGTRERERAEVELKIGTWAIQESRRVLPKDKPDMMCVACASTGDVKAPPENLPTAPPVAAFLPSYPKLSMEAVQPPPYSKGQNHRSPSHNPFHGNNPFLTRTQPAIQAPLLSEQAGQLKGAMSFGTF